jgi:hypothetical protein
VAPQAAAEPNENGLAKDEVIITMPMLMPNTTKNGKARWQGKADDGRYYTVWRGSDAEAYNEYAGQQVVVKALESKFGPSILNVRLLAQEPEAVDTDGNTDAQNREEEDLPWESNPSQPVDTKTDVPF